VVVNGGLEAMQGTTTSLRQGNFLRSSRRTLTEDAQFQWFFIDGTSLAVHPAGTRYISGGEDGFVWVYHFEEPHYKAKPCGNLEIEDYSP
ncbi:hypothetical protein EDB19DRAFT_1644096, partial [Suillus lakei]